RALHLPDDTLPVAGAAPQDVAGAAVAVEVGGILDGPVGWDGVEIDVGQFCGAVHLPGDGGAADVAPQQIGVAVGVEVVRREAAEYGEELRDRAPRAGIDVGGAHHRAVSPDLPQLVTG